MYPAFVTRSLAKLEKQAIFTRKLREVGGTLVADLEVHLFEHDVIFRDFSLFVGRPKATNYEVYPGDQFFTAETIAVISRMKSIAIELRIAHFANARRVGSTLRDSYAIEMVLDRWDGMEVIVAFSLDDETKNWAKAPAELLLSKNAAKSEK